MERDFAKFPDDVNGEILFRFYSQGVDLLSERIVDFIVVFKSKKEMKKFARANGDHMAIVFNDSFVDPEFPYELTVKRIMSPSYENVNEYEMHLQEIGHKYNGKTEGWGFFG